jgi:hypothetical protein
MQFRIIMYLYSENHMKPVNTVRGQNTVLCSVKADATYSNNHCALKG